MATPTSFDLPIVIAGAGKAAWHLSHRLLARGSTLEMVHNRSAQRGAALAQALGCSFEIAPKSIITKPCWVIIGVSDGAIIETAQALAPFYPNALFTHISGAMPASILAPVCGRYGYFYPLQTFSQARMPIWKQIPICIAASNASDLKFLKQKGKKTGGKVYILTDAQKSAAHLAAVFANNFTNYLMGISKEILDQNAVPFEILYALIAETAARVAEGNDPHSVQTGPALRHDQGTMQKHLKQLEGRPDLQALYTMLSDGIQQLPV